MILAAGLGTRLKPLTDTMPKALVPVGGTPLLDLNIHRLMDQGYDRFVVNIHHFAQQIIDHVAQQDYAPMVQFSDETVELLETGGGLKKAQHLFHDDAPILIHNVDILDNVDYDWFSRQHLPEEDAVLLVSKRQTKRYLLFDENDRMCGWTNKATGEIKPDAEKLVGKQLNELAFGGLHVISPSIFPHLERFRRAQGDKFSIIPFYIDECKHHLIHGYHPVTDYQWLDVGKPETLLQAQQLLGND